MAELSEIQYVHQFSDGVADKMVLFALRNVSSDDTANIQNHLQALERAVVMGTTADVTAEALVEGTLVTMPAGLTNDAGWLLVFGSSS
jgi:hypothetical protein